MAPAMFNRPKTWSDHNGNVLLSLATRCTASAKKESILETYIQFVESPRPAKLPMANLENGTIRLGEDNTLQHIANISREHRIY
eukprot:2990458-Lingulodinium_polyedra.AAC.1